MNPISIRVSEDNQAFIRRMSTRGVNQTKIINAALDFLRKTQLQRELTAMAQENPEEDMQLAEEGIFDYFDLIQKDEA